MIDVNPCFHPWRLAAVWVVLLSPLVVLPVRWRLRRAAGDAIPDWERAVWVLLLMCDTGFALLYLGGWALSPR